MLNSTDIEAIDRIGDEITFFICIYALLSFIPHLFSIYNEYKLSEKMFDQVLELSNKVERLQMRIDALEDDYYLSENEYSDNDEFELSDDECNESDDIDSDESECNESKDNDSDESENIEVNDKQDSSIPNLVTIPNNKLDSLYENMFTAINKLPFPENEKNDARELLSILADMSPEELKTTIKEMTTELSEEDKAKLNGFQTILNNF